MLEGWRQLRDGFFLRAEGVYNAASYIDKLDKEGGGMPIICSYGGKSLYEQSHGESCLPIAENRFGGHGLYILDEPEAALSPRNVMRLMLTIDRLAKDGSQFIIATHSPMLMAQPGAQVLELTEAGIEPVEYWATEHFSVMKQFLNNPDKLLGQLFEGGEEQRTRKRDCPFFWLSI